MANYDYSCVNCDYDIERNVPMEERDSQMCKECGCRLNRVYTFKGIVWAPTSTGGGHK